jgi:uncharacterized damage-inducible protein DinB
MMLLDAVREMFEHNYWARNRQLRACAALTPEQFVQPLGGSFPSIRDTSVHLLAVEWLWLERWRGRDVRSLLSAGDYPTVEAVTERWRDVEGQMRSFLDALDEAALERVVPVISTRGEEWRYPLWRMLLHVVDHQNYHRGQITTQLRLLGVTPPRVDFLIGQDAGFRD